MGGRPLLPECFIVSKCLLEAHLQWLWRLVSVCELKCPLACQTVARGAVRISKLFSMI